MPGSMKGSLSSLYRSIPSPKHHLSMNTITLSLIKEQDLTLALTQPSLSWSGFGLAVPSRSHTTVDPSSIPGSSLKKCSLKTMF